MLDESEYAAIAGLHRECVFGIKAFRQKWGSPLESISMEERFRPVLHCYERMTGMKETNVNAILHHRLSKYGPPCERCGKPLRTPQAKLCGTCMFPVRNE